MATYAENAADRERADRRHAQDRLMAKRHYAYDLSAQDRHMKYERPQFAVVTASAAFREGYDAIKWGADEDEVMPAGHRPCQVTA